jgi:hypothetical protein
MLFEPFQPLKTTPDFFNDLNVLNILSGDKDTPSAPDPEVGKTGITIYLDDAMLKCYRRR